MPLHQRLRRPTGAAALNSGEVHIWRINLDEQFPAALPEPSAEEKERAARFRSELACVRYLRSHRALRAILAPRAGAGAPFAVTETGKPWLPSAPDLHFNLSHSHGAALIGLALGVDVGVDIERIRPMPDCLAVAARWFPPGEATALSAAPLASREREFFRRWTLREATLKAAGVGLCGVSAELPGEWTVSEIDAGEGFAAAVAAARADLRVVVRDFASDAAAFCAPAHP